MRGIIDIYFSYTVRGLIFFSQFDFAFNEDSSLITEKFNIFSFKPMLINYFGFKPMFAITDCMRIRRFSL